MLLQVDRVGPEPEPGEVLVVDGDGFLAGRVGGHGLQAVVGRFDRLDDVVAALPADRIGECLVAFQGDLPGAHQVVGGVLGAGELGQQRLAHGPPLELSKRLQVLDQVLFDGLAVGLLGEVRVQGAQPGQARLEGGFLLALLVVPALQVVEDGADLDQRVHPGVDHRAGGQLLPAEESLEIQLVDLVGVLRPPAGGVGEQLHPQVGDRVAQGGADVRGVVVLLDVGGQVLDRVVAQLLAVLPDGLVGLLGLGEDLLHGPGLQVHLALGVHPLALADLPGVAVGVGDQRVGVVEVQHRVAQQVLGPVLLGQETHRGLVPVQGGAQLHRADQAAHPLLGLLLLLGLLQKPLDHLAGRLVLLLVGQLVVLLPALVELAGPGDDLQRLHRLGRRLGDFHRRASAAGGQVRGAPLGTTGQNQ